VTSAQLVLVEKLEQPEFPVQAVQMVLMELQAKSEQQVLKDFVEIQVLKEILVKLVFKDIKVQLVQLVQLVTMELLDQQVLKVLEVKLV